MKFLQRLTIILTVSFCVLASSAKGARVLWDKELVFDANTNSSPLASCANKDTAGLNVITRVGPKGTFLGKGNDCVLWEIGPDGNVLRRTLLKDTDGKEIKTNAQPTGSGCAMATDSLGNLLTVGVLDEQSFAVISTAQETEPNVVAINRTDRFTVGKLIPFKDNTFVLAGRRNKNGLCWKIDNQGKIIKQEQFDLGRNELFTGLDWLKSDDPCIVVVGLSVGPPEDNNVGMTGENFIVLYDPNCKWIREDIFMGWKSVSAFTLTTLKPKVCWLDNGNIVVIYGKESPDTKTRLWARCYTKELKLLWEVEIFSRENSTDKFKLPFYIDVASRGSKGFVAMILEPLEGLKFLFFNENGSKTGNTQYKGMIGIPGFNLMRIGDRTIAVFEEGSGLGSIKEVTFKAKVIALD